MKVAFMLEKALVYRGKGFRAASNEVEAPRPRFRGTRRALMLPKTRHTACVETVLKETSSPENAAVINFNCK